MNPYSNMLMALEVIDEIEATILFGDSPDRLALLDKFNRGELPRPVMIAGLPK